MAKGDPVWALAITMIATHAFFVPNLFTLFRRRWHFEFFISCFGFTTSLFYHTCQVFQSELFLNELQWHRLDNIGAIAAFGVWFTYLADLRESHPGWDMAVKYVVLTTAILLQERDPWNVDFTIAPIVVFGSLPLWTHSFVHRRWPRYHRRQFLLGWLLLGIAIAGFIVGLDDDHDPYRMFHSVWHIAGGMSLPYLWSMVNLPAALGGVGGAAAVGVAAMVPKDVSSVV